MRHQQYISSDRGTDAQHPPQELSPLPEKQDSIAEEETQQLAVPDIVDEMTRPLTSVDDDDATLTLQNSIAEQHTVLMATPQVQQQEQETQPVSRPGIQQQQMQQELPATQPVSRPAIQQQRGQEAQSAGRPGIRQLAAVLRRRLMNPQPEEMLTTEVSAVSLKTQGLGAFPFLLLLDACGVLTISFSYYLSDWGDGNVALEWVFLLGLLVMFIPNLIRYLLARPSRLETICSLCSLGLCFYLVQFMVSPLHFFSFDDYLHWRTVSDILISGHLFSPNSMLPVSSYYPGLELVTASISSMTGLSAFHAGELVIASARFLMVISLFLFFEQVLKSIRMASVAAIIYMANPHFFFFDATYSYETLALPLATFILYILARYDIRNKDHRLVLAAAWLMLAAVTVTHHMTDYTLLGLLFLITVVSFFRPAPRSMRFHFLALLLFGIAIALAYAFLVPNNPVWSYLSRYFGGAIGELDHIAHGSGSARKLFVSAADPSPFWDQLLMLASVGAVTLSIPVGLFCLWQQYRRNVLLITLGIFSLIYPISQLFRFTEYGSEITDRAAAFLFLAIACLFTIIIAKYRPKWERKGLLLAAVSVIVAVVMMGDVVVAVGGDYADLPGPYLVSADGRSIEPEGIQDALWTLEYLGPDNRIGADRINQMLLSTYGDQRIMTRLYDNVDISPLFYASSMTPDEVALLRYAGLNYLVVDQRLTQSLPLVGLYFENDTPTAPMSKAALAKFNKDPKLDRIFDSGNITIYDAGAYFNGQK